MHYVYCLLTANLITIIFNKENCNPRSCIINIAPIVSYKAIPSMFIAAPIGMIKFIILGSISRLLKHLIVYGIVAVLDYIQLKIKYFRYRYFYIVLYLDEVPIAVAKAGPSLDIIL
jgi:hypothetical protein